MAHLTSSTREDASLEVSRVGGLTDEWAVAVYIGGAFSVLYMSTEQAQELAADLARVVQAAKDEARS